MSCLITSTLIMKRTESVGAQRRMQQSSKQDHWNQISEEKENTMNTSSTLMTHQQNSNTSDFNQPHYYSTKTFTICSMYEIVDQLETIYEEQEE